MGVVSGIIMPFQFGTNWSRFSEAAGDVTSPMLAYEGLMAFLSRVRLPSASAVRAQPGAALGAFLRRLDGGGRHALLRVLDLEHQQLDAGRRPAIALRTAFSSGELAGDRLQPLLPYRLSHTVVGFYVTTGFVVIGIAAYYLRRGRFHRGSAHHVLDDAVAA